jgi:hypothetical protein
MATSEHGDEAEVTAFVHHSPGQPPLEPAIQDTAPQGSPSTVPNTPDEVTTHQRERLLTSQVSGAIFHYYVDSELDVIPSDVISSFCPQEVGNDDSKL